MGEASRAEGLIPTEGNNFHSTGTPCLCCKIVSNVPTTVGFPLDLSSSASIDWSYLKLDTGFIQTHLQQICDDLEPHTLMRPAR